MQLTIHNVEKIEFCSSYLSNGNSRAIRITNDEGVSFEITAFGKTDAIAALPKADDFTDLEKVVSRHEDVA